MDPRRLAALLEARGLVPTLAFEQVLAALKPGEHLADRLVAEGHVREADLLHAVAHALGARFVSSQKLEKLRLDQELRTLIPFEACERHKALPISWDRSQRSLTAVMADPSDRAGLGDEPTLETVEHLFVHVALPGAIASAIERCYRARPASAAAGPPEPRPAGTCELCGTAYAADQVECSQCGLMVEARGARAPAEPQIVRALLADPTAGRGHPMPRSIHEAVTRVGFRKQVLDAHVPRLSGEDSLLGSLSEFEAFVVSFVDGRVSLAQLAEATGLTNAEVRSIVASLEERGKLWLSTTPAPETAPAAPPSSTGFDVDEVQEEAPRVRASRERPGTEPAERPLLGSQAGPEPASYFEIDAVDPDALEPEALDSQAHQAQTHEAQTDEAQTHEAQAVEDDLAAPEEARLAAPIFDLSFEGDAASDGAPDVSYADVDPADVVDVELPEYAEAGPESSLDGPGIAPPEESTDESLETGAAAPPPRVQAAPLERMDDLGSAVETEPPRAREVEGGTRPRRAVALQANEGATDKHQAAHPQLADGVPVTDVRSVPAEDRLGALRTEPTSVEHPAHVEAPPPSEPLEPEPPTQGIPPTPPEAKRRRPEPPSGAATGGARGRTASGERDLRATAARAPPAHQATERRLPRVLSAPAPTDPQVAMATMRKLTPVGGEPALSAPATTGSRAVGQVEAPATTASRAVGQVEAPATRKSAAATTAPSNAIQAALKLERSGDVEGAIALLRSAIAKSPRPAPLYNRLALVLLSQKRDAVQARELLDKALELDPENPAYAENRKRAAHLARRR